MKRCFVKIDWLGWHYRLGLITCFGVLLWGLSGLSHPIMTHLQPQPVAFDAPPQQRIPGHVLPPMTVLAAHGIQQVQRLSWVALDGKDYFRVAVDTLRPARYFRVNDGEELLAGDERYARMLASHYTGLPVTDIASARFITEFSDDYHRVNRLLPVWRIQFKGHDGLRAFIDTDQARLSTLVDDTRYLLTRVFRFGHNWAFAENLPRLQLTVMASVLAMALFSASSGLYLYFSRRRHAGQRLAALPRWHRRLGLLVALSTLLFASSGMFHLFMSFQQDREMPQAASPGIALSQLAVDAWQKANAQASGRLDLVTDGSRSYWLLPQTVARSQVAILANEAHRHGHDHAHDHSEQDAPLPGVSLIATDDTSAATNVRELASRWAVRYAHRPAEAIHSAEMIRSFGGEYGFVFKRLPVVKVQFTGPGNPRYYIEPVSGVLAAKINDTDAAEGWTFAYLHKWNLTLLNKDLRDVLVMLFALGNVVVALLGVVMFAHRRRRMAKR